MKAKVKIQPNLLTHTNADYWQNHRVCPHCGHANLSMERHETRTCPLCGKKFNFTTGLKP